ncbi:hypothetical protein Tco_0305169 [Tanacetum coccineum]
MDLKLKLLNRIHSNKSNETHTTYQQLYDTLYESITLDQQPLNAQDSEPSFHKRSHDNQDPPNNCEGKNKKKRQKDVGEPSSISSRRNKSPHPNPEWFPNKSGLAKRRTTWFDLLLKSDIDQNENHILGPSTVAIEKKIKAIIQKDELTIADLEGAGLERLKQMDFFKAKMSTRTEGSVYSDLRIKSVVRVVVKKKWGYGFLTSFVVRRSDDKEYKFSYVDLSRLSLNDVEDMYLFQVQDKLYHLLLEFVKDFNNALFLFIRRVVIQNRVEDIQLGVESYQQTLNLTKPMMFFEGIDQKISFTMCGTHKGVVYLNQHNVKSFMKLSEVKKFCDGTLMKIRENLIHMLKRNKLGTGNKRLKGRDWTDMDVEKSNEMVAKIDKTLKRREQLGRLEEYVGGRPKTVNPRTFGSICVRRSYALSWKPCQGDSLNLPDHRIHKDGDGDASFQLKSDSLPHAHAQSTKTFYKHQDSRIMKAQELKTKTSAQTLIYKIFLQRYQVYQGRLLASFQDDAKYEHVGQDTRSQGGKDDQDKRIKI